MYLKEEEFFLQLTVMENLELGAYLRKDKAGIKEDYGNGIF